jgi:hypothetical protein
MLTVSVFVTKSPLENNKSGSIYDFKFSKDQRKYRIV